MKHRLKRVHADFNLPGLYGIWEQIKYDMKQTSVFNLKILKDTESNLV